MAGVSSIVRDSSGDYNFVFKNQLGDMSVVKIGPYPSARQFMTDLAQGNIEQFYENQMGQVHEAFAGAGDSLTAWAADHLYGEDKVKVLDALQSSNEFVVGGRTIVNAGTSSVADAIAGEEGFDAAATRLGIEDAIGLLVA